VVLPSVIVVVMMTRRAAGKEAYLRRIEIKFYIRVHKCRHYCTRLTNPELDMNIDVCVVLAKNMSRSSVSAWLIREFKVFVGMRTNW
jgi:hypothetical protein